MKRISYGFSAVLILAAGASAPAAWGASISSLSLLNANDVVDWSVIHPNDAQTLSVTSAAGLGVNISEPSDSFHQEVQGAGYAGFFPNGTFIENNQFGGAVTFGFSTPVYGFGLVLEPAFGGNFLGSIQELHGGTVLGTYVFSSTTNTTLFLGVRDTTPDITSVVVGTSSGSGDNYFAFSNVNLLDRQGAASAPEPAAIGTVSLGLAGFLIVIGRRRCVKPEQL